MHWSYIFLALTHRYIGKVHLSILQHIFVWGAEDTDNQSDQFDPTNSYISISINIMARDWIKQQ